MTEQERVEQALHRIGAGTEGMRARGHVQAALVRLYGGDASVDELLDIGQFHFSKAAAPMTDGDFGIYWAIPSMVHLMLRFHDRLPEASGRTIWDILTGFYYHEGHNVVKRDASPNRLFLSENHDSLLKVSIYLLAKYFGERFPRLLDGLTAAEVADALRRYLMGALDGMLSDGWLIEGGEPYNAVTLESYYNLMELSGDAELSVRAKRFIDLYWLMHAAESVNNVRGYARARLYPYWEDNKSAWVSSLFAVYTGHPAIEDGGMMDYLALFDYRPPAEVAEILEDRERMGPYTMTSKLRGGGYYVLEEHEPGESMPLRTPVYYLDRYSQLLRTTYVTQHYNVSGFHFPLTVPYTLVSGQCRWEGATFAQPQGAAVFAGTLEPVAGVFEMYVTLHYKNVILYAPNKNAYWHDGSTDPVTIVRRGDPRFDFHMAFKIDAKGAPVELEIEENRINGRFGDNLFACVTDEGFERDGACYIVRSQRCALIVGHASEQDYELFRADVQSAQAEFGTENIDFTYNGDRLELRYRDDSNRCRLINGEPVDYLAGRFVDSPFVKGRTGGGPFEITTQRGGTVWL